MDRLWEEGKWDNEKNEAILQEHLRTPYKLPDKRKIVLDTNCLIASLSRRGQYFHLIEEDHDDDKFVDCAFAANATFIVSDDKHYDVLQDIDFPKLLVLKLKEFLDLLQSEDNHNV
jgi:predicted nucleic acid-binding protein